MLKFELKHEHVLCGCRNQGDNCPMSLAITEHLKGQYVICSDVDESEITDRYTGAICILDTPGPIADFIEHFDETGEGEPGWFEIDIPQEFLKSA